MRGNEQQKENNKTTTGENMGKSHNPPEHRRRQFTCRKCGTEGIWWYADGETVAMSTTKNSYTPHKCQGSDNIYSAAHPYKTKPADQMEAEARVRLEEIFGGDW